SSRPPAAAAAPRPPRGRGGAGAAAPRPRAAAPPPPPGAPGRAAGRRGGPAGTAAGGTPPRRPPCPPGAIAGGVPSIHPARRVVQRDGEFASRRFRGELDHPAREGLSRHMPHEPELPGLEAHLVAVRLQLFDRHARPARPALPGPVPPTVVAVDVEEDRLPPAVLAVDRSIPAAGHEGSVLPRELSEARAARHCGKDYNSLPAPHGRAPWFTLPRKAGSRSFFCSPSQRSTESGLGPASARVASPAR